MADTLNPVASHHLPSFITAPGQTDVLMVVTAIILAVSVVAFGILFLRLHTLPERMAHGSKKLQFEIVAVLGLIALFTHMHIFWVAGLLLALIDFPDFSTILGRIARSVEKIAGIDTREEQSAVAGEAAPSGHGAELVPARGPDPASKVDGAAAPAARPDAASARGKELGHA